VSAKVTPRQAATSLGSVGAIVTLIGVFGGFMPAMVILLALLGTPLFAVMGGASELAWLFHHDPSQQKLERIAANILTEHFAGSPILVTIPLFTFVGYVLAESKTAERLVRVSKAVFGWMPGGLAIVCVVASAVFTLFTGGSGVTIIAIGGLLYPALRKEGYSERFSLGVLTSGGSIGLLLPFSVPLMIYSIVGHVDLEAANKAVVAPGIVVLLIFSAYAVYVGVKEKIPRKPFDIREVLHALWEFKWELGIPTVLIVGFKYGGAQLDEVAGILALYTVLIEVFVYKDISFKKDVPRITKTALSLGGAIILILSMANALINYVVQEKIPDAVLNFMLKLGIDSTPKFLIAMNLFLLVLGMVMEGFSAILVAVPLILPFAARFHLGPFHTAMIFLVNLELAYCMPPLGLNLFISSFRFNRTPTSLYRPILPFLGVLLAALLLISYVPSISTLTIRSTIAAAREKAEKDGVPPTEAWKLECVQEDPNNPQPCTEEERKKYAEPAPTTPPTVDTTNPPPPAGDGGEDDDLLKMMMGGDGGSGSNGGGEQSDDDLLKQMMGGGGSDAGAAPAPSVQSDDDLLKQMMGAGKDGG
jgi:tripartite ATP-independent transporter DctM subunit